MKKKQKIITCCVFLSLILSTIIYTVVAAVDTYQYEIQHFDILEGLGAAIVLLVGGFLVFYELDLFCTVYYFLLKPKSIAKSVFCILSNLCLILILVYVVLSDQIMTFRKYEIVPFVLFGAYLVFRIVCTFVPVRRSEIEESAVPGKPGPPKE